MTDAQVLERGVLAFSIEGRVLRELGERLVRQPDVAVVELIKNAYDADATECTINYDRDRSLVVRDNGCGMTLSAFSDGWMRVGTGVKAPLARTLKYNRMVTGEKGIGRFAVRFLGQRLRLESVAYDKTLRKRTRLFADFDWLKFDSDADLGKVKVPFRLEEADRNEPTGTTLTITQLRPEAAKLDLHKVQTGSLGVLSPIRSLFREAGADTLAGEDPGLLLNLQSGPDDEAIDVAAEILENFSLRAVLEVAEDRLELKVFARGTKKALLRIVDRYPNQLGGLYADIRFFPKRAGAFANLPVDGRRAYSWVVANSGVAVFDRNFRVRPYGFQSDDWLQLQADAARNRRDPRSSISSKHFGMNPDQRSLTSENWMLRLPQSAQLIGLVQVEGRRTTDADDDAKGLVASADREGFVENRAFDELWDLIRGAVESLAYVDRRQQQAEQEEQRAAQLAQLRRESRDAIKEVQDNPNVTANQKAKIVAALAHTQRIAEEQAEQGRKRELELEVMSLLGVVAGFMTHEFGAAVQELDQALTAIEKASRRDPTLKPIASDIETNLSRLKDFANYSKAYIQGTRTSPTTPYPARPRLLQVKRVFGAYAEDRSIDVVVEVESDVLAPLVPASLYNGVALNLYTNALKAITNKKGSK